MTTGGVECEESPHLDNETGDVASGGRLRSELGGGIDRILR